MAMEEIDLWHRCSPTWNIRGAAAGRTDVWCWSSTTTWRTVHAVLVSGLHVCARDTYNVIMSSRYLSNCKSTCCSLSAGVASNVMRQCDPKPLACHLQIRNVLSQLSAFTCLDHSCGGCVCVCISDLLTSHCWRLVQSLVALFDPLQHRPSQTSRFPM